MTIDSFEPLKLDSAILRALSEIGYERPTPIQALAIPQLLAGKDMLGIAQTGTGKTAAFALPLLQKLTRSEHRPQARKPQALILAPTRELAVQIAEELEAYARYLDVCTVQIFGGVNQNPQVGALAQRVHIVVATPGRLLDLIGQGHLDLSAVSTLVLDEADRLLDMGFVRDVRRIVEKTPRSRQSLLFSATLPNAVVSLANDMLRNPVRVEVTPEVVTVEKIDQRLVMAAASDKRRILDALLHDEDVERAIVFCRTKHGANRVAKQLNTAGHSAEAIHGNKSQSARQRALCAFKAGKVSVLVATDIAARGIDVDGVSHVFNYELPHEPESYVHRIGRTARAGASGVAISLVDPSEDKRLQAIERLTKRSLSSMSVNLEGLQSIQRPAAAANETGEHPPRPRRRRRPRRRTLRRAI
jgi:ATP-dependent RNA helicase RhlE